MIKLDYSAMTYKELICLINQTRKHLFNDRCTLTDFKVVHDRTKENIKNYPLAEVVKE